MNRVYQDIQPNEQEYLWSDQMQLVVGIHRDKMLRLFTRDSQLVLSEEAEGRSRRKFSQRQRQQERQRAERLAEQLRQLGIDPNEI